MDTFGELSVGPYTEVAFVEGLFCTQTVIWDVHGLSIVVGLSLGVSGVAVKRVPL